MYIYVSWCVYTYFLYTYIYLSLLYVCITVCIYIFVHIYTSHCNMYHCVYTYMCVYTYTSLLHVCITVCVCVRVCCKSLFHSMGCIFHFLDCVLLVTIVFQF